MKDEFEYCIIFDDSNIEENVEKAITGVHFYNCIFDEPVEACWYIMHLPRTVFDLKNIHDFYWKGNINKAHNIIFLPSSIAEDYEYQDTTLVVYLGNCEKQAKAFCAINKTTLGYLHLSALNSTQLQTHWNELCTKFSSCKKTSDNMKLVNHDERNSLPLLFLEHYLRSMDDFFKRLNEKFKLFDECFYETLNLRANINACFDKEHNGSNTKELFLKYQQTTGIPITISMMGRKINKKMFPNYNKTAGEKNAVKLVGVHNAIGRDGLYIELNILSENVFELVNNLECACKGKTPNYRFMREGNSDYLGHFNSEWCPCSSRHIYTCGY